MNFPVYEILQQNGHLGEANAIHAQALAVLAGFAADETGLRALRKAVSFERAAGAMILSSSSGYFAPAQERAVARVEIERFCQSNVRRLSRAFQRLRPIQKKLKQQLDGQTTLFAEGDE